jgi:hypothetical protein
MALALLVSKPRTRLQKSTTSWDAYGVERRPHQATQPKDDHRDGQIANEGKYDRAHRPQADDRDQQVPLRKVPQLIYQSSTDECADPQRPT